MERQELVPGFQKGLDKQVKGRWGGEGQVSKDVKMALLRSRSPHPDTLGIDHRSTI